MRTGALMIVLGVALAAPGTAAAAMSAEVNASNVVVVTGDGANDRITLMDGRFAGGDDYGVAMYDTDGGEIAAGGGCVLAPGPVATTYCGDHTVARTEVNLGAGDDTVTGAGGQAWQQLDELAGDLGPGGDTTEGNFSNLPTAFAGGDGSDTLAGGTRSDTLDGGAGEDSILGAGGNDTLRGGPAHDEINGQSGDDTISGDGEADTLIGGDESDTIDGGAGQDNVQGDGGSSTGQGNDVITVDDGEADGVTCGLGGDTVQADQLDVIESSGCESVTRSGGGTGGGGTGGGGTGGGGTGGGGTGGGGTGGGGTTPPPAGPDTTAPAFTEAPTLARTSFRAATAGAMIAQARPRGTTLTLGLSEAATLRFTVRRRAAGRRVRGRCVAPRRSNRRRPRCTRQVRVGTTVTRVVDAGSTSLRFTGRSAGRALRPGAYVLRVVAVDAAGNASQTAALRFRIVR